jgi:hypothetical protein
LASVGSRDIALRLFPGRRQVPGLTYTHFDSMPPYDPAWDQEPIPEFAHGSPFALGTWGSRSFTRRTQRQEFSERAEETIPAILEQITDIQDVDPMPEKCRSSDSNPRQRHTGELTGRCTETPRIASRGSSQSRPTSDDYDMLP